MIADQPLLPFVIGVTGKMALPGYEDSVTDPASFSPAARAVYDRVFAILDWVRHTGASGPPSGCLDPAEGSFDPARSSAGCWRPLGLERTPIVILSSLAPGADTIVAEAALDYAAVRVADVTVRAPLPFPVDVHLRSSTFCPEGKEETWNAKKARFQDLVRRIRGQPTFVEARDLFCVALDPAWEGDPEADLTAGPPEAPRRRLRYRAAGEYVATASHLLIAVDYRRSIKPHPIPIDLYLSGTPAIVESKRRGLSFGLLAISNNFSWVDNGPVLLMPLEDEQTEPKSPCGVGPLVWLHPYDTKPKARESPPLRRRLLIALGLRRPAAPKPPAERQLEDDDPTWLAQGDHLLRRVLHYQEQFNSLPKASREDGALDGMLKPAKATEEGAVQDITLSPPAQTFTDALDPLARVRSRASERSQSLDKERSTLLRRLLLLTLAAASCLGAYEHWDPGLGGTIDAPEPPGFFVTDAVGIIQTLLLLATFGFLFAIALLYHRYRASGVERERYDLRAVSEGLRVQFAWSTAGVPGAVSADYMQRQRGELDWIRYAIQSVSWPPEQWTTRFHALPPRAQGELLERCRLTWVLAQVAFFHKGAHRAEGERHLWHHWGWTLAAAGLLNVFAKLLGAASPALHHAIEHHAAAIAIASALAGAVFLSVGALRLSRETKRHAGDPDDSHDAPPGKSEAFLRWLFDRPNLWGMAFILATVPFLLPHLMTSLGSPWPTLHNCWLILTGITILAGGLFLAWSERNFHAEDSRRYRGMETLFDCANRRLQTLIASYHNHPDPPTLKEIHDILYQLGCDALDENAEWLILHRIHPLEPFMAG